MPSNSKAYSVNGLITDDVRTLKGGIEIPKDVEERPVVTGDFVAVHRKREHKYGPIFGFGLVLGFSRLTGNPCVAVEKEVHFIQPWFLTVCSKKDSNSKRKDADAQRDEHTDSRN